MMKDIELLVDSPKSCRGITDVDSVNKCIFVGCALKIYKEKESFTL